MRSHVNRPTRICIQKAQNALTAALVHFDKLDEAIEEDDMVKEDEMETHFEDNLRSAIHWIIEAQLDQDGLPENHELLVSVFQMLKEAFE